MEVLHRQFDSTDSGKDNDEVTQENSQSEKGSSGSDGNDRTFKSNRQKRNSNIELDPIDYENDKSADKNSKEAAE